MRRNQSLVNNCFLGKGNIGKNNIPYEKNTQNQSNQNNNNNEISLSKTMRISQSTKLIKISK